MAIYNVQMMTLKDYSDYMMGGHGGMITDLRVEADSAKEAIAKTEQKFPGMVVNKEWVHTDEEIKAIQEKKDRKYYEKEKAEAKKTAERKTKMLAGEARNAAEKGLTVEEYREEKKARREARARQTKVKNARIKIEELKKEMAEIQRQIEEKEKLIAKLDY